MERGHCLRVNDKTTCGGLILEGCHGAVLEGSPMAREGDSVSCGMDQKSYPIVGGFTGIRLEGRSVAGTRHSISGCPCGAKLIPINSAIGYDSDSGTVIPVGDPVPAPYVLSVRASKLHP